MPTISPSNYVILDEILGGATRFAFAEQDRRRNRSVIITPGAVVWAACNRCRIANSLQWPRFRWVRFSSSSAIASFPIYPTTGYTFAAGLSLPDPGVEGWAGSFTWPLPEISVVFVILGAPSSHLEISHSACRV